MEYREGVPRTPEIAPLLPEERRALNAIRPDVGRISPAEIAMLHCASLPDLVRDPIDDVFRRDCVDDVREFRRRAEATQLRPGASESPVQAWSDYRRALAAALTATTFDEARQLDSVQSFRATVLGEELLELASVVEWARAQSDVDDSSTHRLELPKPGGYVVTVGYRPAGRLEWLYRLADGLVNDYSLESRASAVAFVLCGILTLVDPMVVSNDGKFVTMRVHCEASPADVAEAFRRERAEHSSGHHRSIELSTLRKVAHAGFRRLDEPDLTWRRLFKRWRDRFEPDREIADVVEESKTFNRTVSAARRRLV